MEEIIINKYKKHKGVTLVELIAIIAIVPIVFGVIFSIINNGNKLYKTSLAQSYNQQDVRVVSDYIKRELRNANTISVTAAAIPSSNSVYYALTFKAKTVGASKYLYKQTYNTLGTLQSEQAIGNTLTSLHFLSSTNLGMLKVSIDDSTGGKDYLLGIEFLINNLSSLSILTPSTDVSTIYYAKN